MAIRDFGKFLDRTIGNSFRDAILNSPGDNWLPGSGKSTWLADQRMKILNERSQMLAPAHGEAPVPSPPRPFSFDDFLPTSSPKPSTPKPRPSPGYDSGSPSAASLDYLNADLAKYYGMDQTTAYNEALSNTSYQRAVKDMQSAGLNPAVLFGNGRVSGSEGVFGAAPLSAGVAERSYSGRSRRNGKLFSSSTYAMISGLGALAGAALGAATGGSAGLGALTGSNLATSAAKVLNGFFGR